MKFDIDQFKAALEKEREKILLQCTEFCKTVAVTTYRYITTDSMMVGMAYGSPVLTGRYYTSHRISINGINRSTEDPNEEFDGTNPYPQLPLSNAQMALRGFKLGDVVYIANSLPYAQRIEDGWSKLKAPEGVYQIAADAIQVKFKDAKIGR